MTLADLPLRTRVHVLAFAAGLRAGRKGLVGGSLSIDDYERTAHAYGMVGRPERAAYGYVKTDAQALRSRLRELAVKVTLDDAEGLLAEALVWCDEGRDKDPRVPGDGGAARTQAYRSRLGSYGFCKAGCGRPAIEGRTKCEECAAKVKAAVYASRARKRLAQL